MKILNRNIRLSELPTRMLSALWAIFNIFRFFKHPLEMLWHYIRSTTPKCGYITLRNGYNIYFSNHAHDLITTVVVFCKQDYGKIKPGSVVLDIGANIGTFSLYAAMAGAQNVYAFEPNKEAYKCLVKNAEINGLTDIIKPFQLAVTDRTGGQVQIPVAAGPYNAIRDETTEAPPEQAYMWVETITLDDILRQYVSGKVDLLKMDCEGAEYVIIPASQTNTLSQLAAIKMEYHEGPLSELVTHLENHNFSVVKQKKEQPQSGIIWFKNLSE